MGEQAMKTNTELRRFGVCATVVLLALGAAAEATTFSIKAVKHNPVCTSGLVGQPCLVDADCDDAPISGVCGGDITPTNTLTVREGDIIVTEVYLSDWSPDGERARVYQVAIDRFSFFNDDAGGAVPVHWDRKLLCSVGCFTNDDCPVDWPCCVESQCYGCDHDPTAGAFIDKEREDWVFYGVPDVIARFETCSYRAGAAPLDLNYALIYGPPPKYAATLILEILPDSRKTFTIGFVPDATFVRDEESRSLFPFDLE